LSFEVSIVRIGEVLPIAGADVIETVTVGDYRSIVKRGEYKPGDLVAYIPESAIVPASLLQEMGLEGKLAGAGKNRVKAIKLRGTLSQGLVYPMSGVCKKKEERGQTAWQTAVAEGENVAELLGITKYDPEPPAQFAGKLARPRGNYSLINYDIENIKKFKDVLVDGEEVVFTEKIHGTFMQAVYWPKTDEFAVSSKGLGGRGFIIEDVEENVGNTYIRAAKKFKLDTMLRTLAANTDNTPDAVFVLGEVFGKGIQDLGYGLELQFRVFDIGIYQRSEFVYQSPSAMRNICGYLGLEAVPLLYQGPFNKEILHTYTNGLETVSGTAAHIREGVVIRPVVERHDRALGRVILKSVSEQYLLRKATNGAAPTEYN
jgi:RNA ligase (TIGR02306 family)